MSAHGTKDASGAPQAPGCSAFSMRELLEAGAAANTISTPPDGDDAAVREDDTAERDGTTAPDGEDGTGQ
jgi:hypothetical protein